MLPLNAIIHVATLPSNKKSAVSGAFFFSM
jgi:hypothetical protein